jgi:protein-disulfide isomerase
MNDTTLSTTADHPVRDRVLQVIELVLLGLSAGAALLLVLEHFTQMSLPGCGPDSACATLAAGPWGSLGGWLGKLGVQVDRLVNVPVSFLGLAYFLALAVAWAMRCGGVPVVLRWLVRVGALASVGFLAIMVREREFCIYCVSAHVANLTFWLLMETTGRRRAPALRPTLAVAVVFVLLSAGLVFAEVTYQRVTGKRREAMLAKAIGEVVASVTTEGDGEATADESGMDVADKPARGGRRARKREKRAAARRITVASRPPARDAIGQRYCRGPEQAKIRVVLFVDFQCPICNHVDQDVQKILEQYPSEVSVAIRHFPLCTDCNYVYTTENTHPNACRAARAAEAAGILKGTDGFWRMSAWLYERRAKFSDDELRDDLASLGFEDADQFMQTMNGPEVLHRIFEDIGAAYARHVRRTPGIYINGVVLQGGENEGALLRAVNAIVAKQRSSTPASSSPKAASEARAKPS